MLGITVALLQEIFLRQTIAPPSESMEAFSLTVISTIVSSSLYAIVVSTGGDVKPGTPLFLEGVLASLTSIHRSKSSVTSPLNSALDEVVDQIIVGLDLSFEDQDL